MKNWVNSAHCKSGMHCGICMENNDEWIKSMSDFFIEFAELGKDFKCPILEEERNRRIALAEKEKKRQLLAAETREPPVLEVPVAEKILDRKEDLNDKFSPIIKAYRTQIENSSCGRCARRRIRRKFLAQIEEISKR